MFFRESIVSPSMVFCGEISFSKKEYFVKCSPFFILKKTEKNIFKKPLKYRHVSTHCEASSQDFRIF
jgi:hypothetical protein